MEGLLSEKIALKQGLLQGCNLAPTLFNIYSSVVMNIAKKELEGIGIKYAITSKLSNGTTLEKIKEILDILYADDAMMITLCKEDLQKVMDVLNRVADKFGMILSHEKTEVMVMEMEGKIEQVNITVRDYVEERKSVKKKKGRKSSTEIRKILKQTNSIKYLGYWITSNRLADKEISNRISMASSVWARVKYRFTCREFSMKLKARYFNMFISNTITRDLEIRGLREDEMKKLEVYYNDKVRSLTGYHRMSMVPMEKILESANLMSFRAQVMKARMKFVFKQINRPAYATQKLLCNNIESSDNRVIVYEGKRIEIKSKHSSSWCNTVRDDMNALGFTIGQFNLKRGEFDEQLNKAINNYTVMVNESKERSRKVRDAEDPERKKRAIRRMSGDKDASSRFPVLIDNSGQKAKWKLLMAEITRKYQENVESKKIAKKVRKEAETAAMDTINSLVTDVIRRVRHRKEEEEALEKECKRVVNDLMSKIEKQMKEAEKLQKAQKKREKKDEKEKKLMEIESTAGRQQTTTRSGRVTKSTKRLNE